MRRLLWAVISVLGASQAQSGTEITSTEARQFYRNDHVFGLQTSQIRYEYLLSQTVFTGFPRDASLAFYELPASGPERGVWMHSKGNDYIVVLAQAKTNLWQWAGLGKLGDSDRLDILTVIKAVREAKLWEIKESELPKYLGERVEKAWHGALSHAKGGENRSGLDGASLVFRAYSAANGGVSWDAWTPAPTSVAGRLQMVALALGRYCEDRSTVGLEAALDDLQRAEAKDGSPFGEHK